MAQYGSAALRVAVKANIAGHLAEFPHGLDIQTLARRVQITPGKLGSVMRLLAVQHCFREGGLK